MLDLTPADLIELEAVWETLTPDEKRSELSDSGLEEFSPDVISALLVLYAAVRQRRLELVVESYHIDPFGLPYLTYRDGMGMDWLGKADSIL
jgi:hypothetical protein